MKEKIAQSVKTAYQKYGLKDSTRQDIISMIEAEAAKRELTPETEDAFIAEQIGIYEFAAKLAQKEATARPVPTPTPAPDPNPTPTPAAFDMQALAKIIADNNKAQADQFAATVKTLQDQIIGFQTEKTKSEIISQGWSKYEKSNPYPELKQFALIAKEQTDAKAETFKTGDEYFEAFNATYNRLASATGKENGYRPLDSSGNPVEEKSQFEKNVEALAEQEKANSYDSFKERLGIN